MPSLARSLLALAVVALLQVASAQIVKALGPIGSGQPGELGEQIGRPCPSNLFGRRSRTNIKYDLAPVHFHNIVNDVFIDDPREHEIGPILVGEEISVCTVRGVHVEVTLTDPKSLDYVRVTSNETDSPTVKTMYVTRYREFILPPRN
ncbi:uncharacterized protein [Choristoneura fumiferana]|uniref:uncharacterized protein n=1 Tax=Choristoneura fumiferana TaxID=7141 RepID=UPI003D15E372